MSKNKNQTKASLIFWPIIYFLVVLGMCVSGTLLFHSFYYHSIYVQGPSMQPTLNDNYYFSYRRDFGLVDVSETTIRRLKRFDIVITYFPWVDYENDGEYQPGNPLKPNVDYKIKRLIALPGETIQIKDDYSITLLTTDGRTLIYDNDKDSEAETSNLRLPYNRKLSGGGSISQRVGTWTLTDNQYFLMGDNWDVSEDCSKHYPVYRENLVGRLVCIEGTCVVDSYGEIVDKQYTGFKPY